MPAAEPPLPEGTHRGRISVAPDRVHDVGCALARVDGLRWAAELRVGTVHVAADDAGVLAQARDIAHAHDGWMLREAGNGISGFGRPLPNLALLQRIKAAFDPAGKLSPGRLPL
jgi:FAD/FMN-containing dehydrogenase